MMLLDTLTALDIAAGVEVWTAPPAKSIPGVAGALNTIMGWALWIVSVLSMIGLMIVAAVGYESYRHNQGEQFMEGAKKWILAAIVGSNAGNIVTVFFPGFRFTAIATAIPGLEGPVVDIIGNIVWLLQWAAVACIIFLAIRGFLAYKNDGVQDFIDKFLWFIVASLLIAFGTTIAGAFFPAALTFG